MTPVTTGDERNEPATEADVLPLCEVHRDGAAERGFCSPPHNGELNVSSEIAPNVIPFAGGVMGRVRQLREDDRLITEHEGPGIADDPWVLREGARTGRNNGLRRRVPGARNTVDAVEVDSEENRGTRVVMDPWR